MKINIHSRKIVFAPKLMIAQNFFTGKSFLKFFLTFKLEIEFHSHEKVVSPKLENSAHLFIVNFKCAKFQTRVMFGKDITGKNVGKHIFSILIR